MAKACAFYAALYALCERTLRMNIEEIALWKLVATCFCLLWYSKQ